MKEKISDLERLIHKLRRDSWNGKIFRHGVVRDIPSWDWGFRAALGQIEETIETKKAKKR